MKTNWNREEYIECIICMKMKGVVLWRLEVSGTEILQWCSLERFILCFCRLEEVELIILKYIEVWGWRSNLKLKKR
jgi:hypothetical protein